jgi:hypothetical protein
MPRYEDLSEAERQKVLARASPSRWSEIRLGYRNAPFHRELYRLAVGETHLCIVAPREHAKTQVLGINFVCWSCRYTPGLRALVIASTEDNAVRLKARLDETMRHGEPQTMPRRDPSEKYTTFRNGSRVDVASSQSNLRGQHPDLVIVDDLLDEEHATSELARRRTNRWFGAVVGGLSHPGDTRTVGGRRRSFAATKTIVCGTPQHDEDLLAGVLRKNPIYVWRRYAASYDDTRLPLPDSLAVQVGTTDAPAESVTAEEERQEERPGPADDPDGKGMGPGRILGWKGGVAPFRSAGDSMRRWGI